jgi:hypothetical protein
MVKIFFLLISLIASTSFYNTNGYTRDHRELQNFEDEQCRGRVISGPLAYKGPREFPVNMCDALRDLRARYNALFPAYQNEGVFEEQNEEFIEGYISSKGGVAWERALVQYYSDFYIEEKNRADRESLSAELMAVETMVRSEIEENGEEISVTATRTEVESVGNEGNNGNLPNPPVEGYHIDKEDTSRTHALDKFYLNNEQSCTHRGKVLLQVLGKIPWYYLLENNNQYPHWQAIVRCATEAQVVENPSGEIDALATELGRLVTLNIASISSEYKYEVQHGCGCRNELTPPVIMSIKRLFPKNKESKKKIKNFYQAMKNAKVI